MKKVALIIIYNHKYDKNIEPLEKLYANRFSNIFHLVPFYSGNKSNVIPVYESSHYFQGYVSQGLNQYFKEDFEYYFFIGDDVFLNPQINENNYQYYLHLNGNNCFIPFFVSLHKSGYEWERVTEGYNWNGITPGVEALNEIPSYENALKKFEHHGLEIEPIKHHRLFAKAKRPGRFNISSTIRYWKQIRGYKKRKEDLYHLKYPLVGAYSDIFVIPGNKIQVFCHYCGVFAATRLFVELAIPTAIVLVAEEIVTENDLNLQGKALWVKKDFDILAKYDNQIQKLIMDFPPGLLYLHPIKLSKWK